MVPVFEGVPPGVTVAVAVADEPDERVSVNEEVLDVVADRLLVEDIVRVIDPVLLETILLVLVGLPLCETVFVALSDRDPNPDRVVVVVSVADIDRVRVALVVGLRDGLGRVLVAVIVGVVVVVAGATPRVRLPVVVGVATGRIRVGVGVGLVIPRE